MSDTFGAANDERVTYRLNQEMLLQGPFGGLGVSARFPIGERLGVVGRLGIAGLAAEVSNEMSGYATGERGGAAPLLVAHERTTVRRASLLVTPEVGFEASFGGVVLGAGLGATVSTIPGPTFGERRLYVLGISACALGAPSLGACAQDEDLTSGERSYGAFVTLVPQVSARYQFD